MGGCVDEPDLFQHVPDIEPDEMFLRRLAMFAAPIARYPTAVIDDVDVLSWAKAVYAACGDLDGTGDGLTAAELQVACEGAGPGSFESRLGLFKSMGLLSPPVEHAFQRRLLFSSTGVAALLVYERLRQDGGVQELVLLLDQTRQGIADGTLTPDEVHERLATLRRGLSISAGELLQLRTRPVEELISQRRGHPAADGLLTDARGLVEIVESRFPEFSAAAGHLITQALRYSAAANDLVERLLRQVTADRDFSMLRPEQYRSAAQYSAVEDLSAVLAHTVFDRPAVKLGPQQVLEAVQARRPREVRVRPALPIEPTSVDDPVERARSRRDAARRRRVAEMQLYLQGKEKADLTAAIRSAGWPGAARLVSNLLTADADPAVPVEVDLSVTLLVEPGGPVTYLTPLRLRRLMDEDDHG